MICKGRAEARRLHKLSDDASAHHVSAGGRRRRLTILPLALSARVSGHLRAKPDVVGVTWKTVICDHISVNGFLVRRCKFTPTERPVATLAPAVGQPPQPGLVRLGTGAVKAAVGAAVILVRQCDGRGDCIHGSIPFEPENKFRAPLV